MLLLLTCSIWPGILAKGIRYIHPGRGAGFLQLPDPLMQSTEISRRKCQRSFVGLCILQLNLLIITGRPGVFRLVDTPADGVPPLTARPADGFLTVAARLALTTGLASKGNFAAPAARLAKAG